MRSTLYVAKKFWRSKTELIYVAGYAHLALAERIRQAVKIPIAILGGAGTLSDLEALIRLLVPPPKAFLCSSGGLQGGADQLSHYGVTR